MRNRAFFALAFILAASAARGATIYVDLDAPGAPDGLSWGTAYLHPQDAMDAASPGSEVWVAEGTYHRRGGSDTTLLVMAEGVAVYGGFAGTETSLGERDWNAHETILDGGSLCYHVVSVAGVSGAVLDGFTVTGGKAAGLSTDDMRGGGLYGGLLAEITAANCVFRDNVAMLDGAGMFLASWLASATNCTFEANSAGRDGGAVAVDIVSPVITNSVFRGNDAVARGGGICFFVSMPPGEPPTPEITSCTFNGNAAAGGGAVYARQSQATLTNCILWGDSASAGSEIVEDNTTITVNYSCVEGGWAGTGNTSADPLFVDPGAGDLHLRAGSPCIDAADGDLAPAQDKDGNDRWDDTGTGDTGAGAYPYEDIGAYEFQGTTPPDWIAVLQPQSDDPLAVGESIDIRWASSGTFADVKIEVYREASGWETIVASTPDDGSHPWTVTHGGQSLPQEGCIIRVTYTGGEATDAPWAFAVFTGVWYVDDDAPAGGDGFSWGTAFLNPRDALDVATSGDEIWVSEGTYKPATSGADPRRATFALVDGVAMYGGFAGGETLLSERDWSANVTVLSGDIGAAGDPSDNSYNVVTGATDSTVDGFTISGGNAYNAGNRDGGGMFSAAAVNLTVANCEFIGNSANDGGGMCNIPGTVVIIDRCIFRSNTATYGGAMKSFGATVTVTRTAFLSNSSNLFSGAMDNWNNVATDVTNCTFVFNSSGSYGGAIHNDGCSPTITNCTFYGNSADNGGAMHNRNAASPIVTNCVFWGDIASVGSDPELFNEVTSSPVVTYSDVEGTWPGAGNIDADPLFVGPAVGNVRLRTGSPCANLGTPTGAPGDDFDGNARPYGAGYDMGAFEWQGETFAVWHVTPGGTGDGSSWLSPVGHPQDAADFALSGDEVWVARGTYARRQGTDTVVLSMAVGVAFYGGFAGTESARDERDWTANVTTLDGEDACYHAAVGALGATLDGFTLTRGNANGAGNDARGGGMLNANVAGVQVRNCVLLRNSAITGGGMCNTECSPTVEDCLFKGNSATAGGGMWNYLDVSSQVTSCAFLSNTAFWGGGMECCYNAHPTLTNCVFANNTVSDEGGGMLVYETSTATLMNCSFGGNSAGSGAGGAILTRNGGSVTATNCIFWGDSAGLFKEIDPTATVTYSCVEGGFDGTGNIGFLPSHNPLYAGAPAGNLRLRGGSGCIDSADGDQAPALDLDGNARHDDPGTVDTGTGAVTYVDMGAYEWQGQTSYRWYVRPGGPGDGSSWAKALDHPKPAADSAQPGEEVWVAEGTYVWDNWTPLAVLPMAAGVPFYGGFAGTEAARGERDWVARPTVLDGEDFCWNVVIGASDATLDGFVVTRGSATGGGGNGGGMLNVSAINLVVANCTFIANSANNAGGGMFNDSCNPTVTDCSFLANSATSGGGMYNTNASPVVTGCIFSGNIAFGEAGGMGGDASSPIVSECIFSGNQAGDKGGGLRNWGPAPVIANCVFTDNAAVNHGGAVSNVLTLPEFTNCTFWGNSAGAGKGGAIHNASADAVITNCILWGDSAGVGPEISDEMGSTTTVTYSCVEGGYAGTGNIGELASHDPLFVDPDGADNVPGTPDDDLRLSAGSECIDRANGNVEPATDMDWNARWDDAGMDDLGIGDPTYADMGAYEFQGVSTPVITVTAPTLGEIVDIGTDYAISWTTTGGRVLLVDIDLSRTGGSGWGSLASSVANTGSWLWAVDAPESNLCLIRVKRAGTAGPGDPGDDSELFSVMYPAPVVDTVLPGLGPWQGGTTVTITGSNFRDPLQVLFDGLAAVTVTYIDSTQVVAETPQHAAGAVDVEVVNPNPNARSGVKASGFTYSGGPGDLDGDLYVGVADMAIILANHGLDSSYPTWDPRADPDGNGLCNMFDLWVVCVNWAAEY